VRSAEARLLTPSSCHSDPRWLPMSSMTEAMLAQRIVAIALGYEDLNTIRLSARSRLHWPPAGPDPAVAPASPRPSAGWRIASPQGPGQDRRGPGRSIPRLHLTRPSI